MSIPLSANFIVPPTGITGVAVDFRDASVQSSLSSSPIVSWHWKFGDGTESTEKNPAHIYNVAGVRTIQLTVVNAAGDTNTLTLANEIRIVDDVALNVPICDTSMRYAITAAQGNGFALNGSAFPSPAVRTDSLQIADANQYPHSLIFDATDGFWYDITTRNGAQGSGLTETWIDKEDAAAHGVADGDTDVQPEVWFGEDTGEEWHQVLQHVESHFGFRPGEETNRGKTGYNDLGYLTGFKVDMTAYADGEPELASSVSKEIPLVGDVVTNYKVRARRIQMRVKTSKSNHDLLFRGSFYTTSDAAADPDTNHQPEMDHQAALANVAYWLTLCATPGVDLVSGRPLAVLPSAIAGPDGSSTSAFRTAAPMDTAVARDGLIFAGWAKTGQTLEPDMSAPPVFTPKTVNFAPRQVYHNDITATGIDFDERFVVRMSSDDTLPTPLLPDTDYMIHEEFNGDLWFSEIATPTFIIPLTDAGAGTHNILQVNRLVVPRAVIALDDPVYTVGSWGLYIVGPIAGGTYILGTGDWFDIRMLPSISDAAAAYLGDDVKNAKGANTLPIWDV